MYSLDIETLIGVLQNRQIYGFLKADISSGQVSGVGRGSVVVVLKEGKIDSVSIYDGNGRLLFQGRDALGRLRRVVFTWQLEETPPAQSSRAITTTNPSLPGIPYPVEQSPSLTRSDIPVAASRSGMPVSAMSMGSLVPIRYQQLSSDNLQYLSRNARGIYTLTNGTNTIQRISALLSLPLESVYAELVALQGMQLVVITNGSQRPS